MKLQFHYRITLFLILALSLAACGSPATGAPTATPIHAAGPTATQPASPTLTAVSPSPAPSQTVVSSASTGCTNAYFPLASGATWMYTSTGSIAGDYTYTRTLSGLSDSAFTTVDAFSSGITRTINWSCNGGKLTTLASATDNSSVSTKSAKMTIDLINATGYVIPNAFTDGSSWSEDITFNGTMVQNGAKTGTSANENKTDCKDAGSESVKVPVGTLSTVKITCHSNLVTTVTLNAITGDPVTTIQRLDRVVRQRSWARQNGEFRGWWK